MSELTKTADALTEKSIGITITTNERHWLKRWFSKKVHVFELRPLSLGTMIKISRILVSIPEGLFDGKPNLKQLAASTVVEHGEQLAQMIALALVNRKEDPPVSMVNLILHNMTASDILGVCQAVFTQMDTHSFLRSIISIRGINMLTEMNPQSQGS